MERRNEENAGSVVRRKKRSSPEVERSYTRFLEWCQGKHFRCALSALPRFCVKCNERSGAFCKLYGYDLELRPPLYSCKEARTERNRIGYMQGIIYHL